MSKLFKIAVIILLILTAINALIAGGLFILDPSGQKMGMTTDYLKHSPFSSFLIPGIILFIVNGILNLFTATITIKKSSQAIKLIILQGILLCGWIVVQVLMVQTINPLHIAMFVIGTIFILYGAISYQKVSLSY